jgi:uncharacterized protein (TIGR02246 family)
MKPGTRSRARLFATPDEAESAFYDAFERANLAQMMTVWAETDDIVCVHPQGPRLTGFEQVRESWMQIFAGGSQMRIRATEVRKFDGQSVAVHAVVEVLGIPGQQGPAQSVCATNVYELTDAGWRMVVHHATAMPEPAAAAAEEESSDEPHTLH